MICHGADGQSGQGMQLCWGGRSPRFLAALLHRRIRIQVGAPRQEHQHRRCAAVRCRQVPDPGPDPSPLPERLERNRREEPQSERNRRERNRRESGTAERGTAEREEPQRAPPAASGRAGSRDAQGRPIPPPPLRGELAGRAARDPRSRLLLTDCQRQQSLAGRAVSPPRSAAGSATMQA